MSYQRKEEESKLPRQGILLVAGIVAAFFAGAAFVDFFWRLLTR
jgi:hypothetical protein